MKKIMLSLFVVFVVVGLVGCNDASEKPSNSSDDQQSVTFTQTYQQGVIQETKYGTVQGYENLEENTLVWKGIPYAKSPVGDLRWKAPEDPDTFEGIYDATSLGNIAIQTSADGIIGSEDCLNLDIYRPNTDETDLPVFVYIHGGNNQTGTSEEITGDAFVNDLGAIFVSVNYRLGPLGFNPLPALNTGDELEDSGNYALLDIAKSLDWVKENIESFGGNPTNITISGFSAGGRDVMAMLISPIFEGKFQKAIAFSGGMTIADEQDSMKVFADAIAPLVVEDGVKTTEDEAYEWLLQEDESVKEYLYSLSAERLSGLMSNAMIRMSVFPHLYNDGKVIPEEQFDTEDYNSVPLIMFTGTTEFSFFAMGDPYFASSFQDGSVFTDSEKSAQFDFAKKYGSMLYKYFNTQESALKMYDHYEAPIYTMEMPFGENLTETTDMDAFGSFHGVFVPLLDTNNTSYLSFVTESYQLEGAQKLKEQFRGYLANFLHNDDPNGDGLENWEPWTMENQVALQLTADENNVYAQMNEVTESKADMINEIEKDSSISMEVKDQIISEVLNGRWFSTELDEYFKNSSLWVE
ncbi:carboxylesterase family protein [Fervidibacillus halotolerans]|uniref:Carboxylic ester hydrolase n=1 Tax=Fervidibacillus halotolerans TaxID=2980027 RepID=A0A9E8RY32_9BACI|nr:carboxylesterase family protein [Fervidibacillus halotolerans]WAA12436.1 carboxylesterase family protein [Fervidibacillus halotolerans]